VFCRIVFWHTESQSILYCIWKKTTCLNRASVEAVFSPQQEGGKLSLLQVLKIQTVNEPRLKLYLVLNKKLESYRCCKS